MAISNLKNFLRKGLGFERQTAFLVFLAITTFLLLITFHEDFRVSFNSSSYLTVHTILEAFSIVISFSIALQIWHLSSYKQSRRSLLLGALFLSIGTIDLMHTLTYKGMPFFNIITTGAQATWFWVTARQTEAALLFLSVWLREQKVSSQLKIYIYSGSLIYSLTVTFVIIFGLNSLPLLLDDQGVTPLKVGMEYVIGALHLTTFSMILQKGKAEFSKTSGVPNVWTYSLLALLFLLLGELIFTLYKSVYDIENFMGHIYKCFGYYFIYKGILVESIREPFLREQKANAESQAYREELEQFFHLSLDALVIADFEGRLYRWNPTFQKLLGYDDEEMKEKQIGELLYPEDRTRTEHVFQELAQGNEITYYEDRYLSKEGAIRWFAWSATPMVGKGLFYAVGKDITERKKLEQEMARLDRLNLVAELAAGISHEVRNPMTTIRGFLQILQRKERDSQNCEYYNLMIEELDRANSIITEFLALGKNKTVNFAQRNLNDIISALAPLIEADALRQDKNLSMELSALPPLYLDEKEIRQVLLNLARNGLEAMPPGGVIRIRTYIENNKVILAVQDQGSGIPPSVLEKLGTPFITTKEGGTGLGLATCYSIAARHRARIHVETGNAGTTFFVEFDPQCGKLDSVVAR